MRLRFLPAAVRRGGHLPAGSLRGPRGLPRRGGSVCEARAAPVADCASDRATNSSIRSRTSATSKPACAPQHGQRGFGDRFVFREHGQLQVPLPHVAAETVRQAVVVQAVHAGLDRAQQIGMLVAGKLRLQLGQVVLLQSGQRIGPSRRAALDHGADHRQGQRQIAALPRHFGRLGRQRLAFLARPLGQQLQRFLRAQQVHAMHRRAQTLQARPGCEW